jgi:hypothetical protein
LLGSGLCGLLVGGQLEVGEVVSIEVVVEVGVVEVYVLLLGAAGAGALRPKFLSELAPEACGGARRVEDVLLLRSRVQVGGV